MTKMREKAGCGGDGDGGGGDCAAERDEQCRDRVGGMVGAFLFLLVCFDREEGRSVWLSVVFLFLLLLLLFLFLALCLVIVGNKLTESTFGREATNTHIHPHYAAQLLSRVFFFFV